MKNLTYMFKVEKRIAEECIAKNSPVPHWCCFNLVNGKCWVCGNKPNKSIKMIYEEWRTL